MSLPSNFKGSRRSALIGGVIVLALAASIIWSVLDRRTEITELVASHSTFIVEIARTPRQRAKGLSNRERIEHDGLLLVWDAPGRHPIWMAEMRFALDLVWLDASGRVLAVFANVAPCDRQPCPMYEPPGTDRSTAVLEMPAGRATRYGIAVGSAIDARGVNVFAK
jgi:uncharacterized membrane protein (UPF0127 family)